MRKVIIAVILAFVVTLAAGVGSRMSAEAMAVVVGVVCGVAAGIPMSLLLMLIINRRGHAAEDEQWQYKQQHGRYGAYPPVVVIQGGAPAPSNALPPYYPTQATAESTRRQFHIIGTYED